MLTARAASGAKAAARGSGAAAFGSVVGPDQYQPLACQKVQAPHGLP